MAICAGPVQSFPRQGMEGDGSDVRRQGGGRPVPRRRSGVAPCPVARIVRSGLGSDPLLDAEGDTGRRGDRTRTPLPRRIHCASRQTPGEASGHTRGGHAPFGAPRTRHTSFQKDLQKRRRPHIRVASGIRRFPDHLGTCSRTAARRKGSHHPQFAEPAGLSGARGA